MRKKMTRTAMSLLCVFLLLFLTACGPKKPVPPVTTNPTSTESTSSPTSFAEQTTTTHPTSTTSTSLTTSPTTTQTQKPQTTTKPVIGDIGTVLPKKFSDYDSKTKDFLVSCGLTKELLDVDKQKLTCTEKGSQHEPFSETYERGGVQYTFDGPNGPLTAFIRYEPIPVAMGKEKSEAEILAIARQLAGLYIPVSEYRESVSLYGDDYTVSYCWCVGEYETSRFVTIDIRKDGVVEVIFVDRLDILQEMSAPKIDEEALYRECDNVLKKSYYEKNYVSFEILDKVLDVKDERYLVRYQWQPEIKNGEVVLLCNCSPLLENGIKGRLRWVAVPLSKVAV